MPRVEQGDTITLYGEYRDSGALVDPVDPRISIYDPANALIVGPVAPTKDGVGRYHYDYAVAAAAALGTWRARWTGTISGAASFGDEYFDVVVPGGLSEGFPTPVELADYLEVPAFAAGSQKERRANLLLELALGAVQSETKQTLLAVEDETVELPGGPDRELWLPERPVRDVSAISINGLPLVVGSYRWRRSGRLVRVPAGVWAEELDVPIAVTYSHGFLELPSDIRGVILSAAARAWENPEGLLQETLGGSSSSWRKGSIPLDAEEKAQLAPYAWGGAYSLSMAGGV